MKKRVLTVVACIALATWGLNAEPASSAAPVSDASPLLQKAKSAGSLNAALEILRAGYPRLDSNEDKARVALQLADYLMAEEAYSESAQWYAKAKGFVPHPAAYTAAYRLALCELKLGENSAAAESLRFVLRASNLDSGGVAEGLRDRSSLLLAWSLLADRQADEADLLARTLAAKSLEPELCAGLLLFQYALGLNRGTSDDQALNALQANYPGSPEAAIALYLGGKGGSAALSLKADPFFYLNAILPRLAPASIAAASTPIAVANASPAAPSPQPTLAPPSQTALAQATPSGNVAPARSPAAPAPSPSAAADNITFYQIGIFSQKANADKVIASLKKKGFNAVIREKKDAKGLTLYSVLVPGGADPNDIGLRLKEAGFETYPLFER
jgi:cell division septation protein DedD